jgi:hypothetical protein
MACCNNPKHKVAWVWFWPFKAKYCANCEDVTLDCGKVLSWIWLYFVWPFWKGQVDVEE